MCTVSNIGDYWNRRWPAEYPWIEPYETPFDPNSPMKIKPGPITITGVSRQEFEALKKEVQELKELIKAAQKFDEATNQPHCEHEDKVALIKKIAELVGVDMTDVLK